MELADGVTVGHWTDRVGRTGCTVVRFPTGTIGSGEIRGGAPATREFALLDPSRTVDEVHAVVLTGGSAFGLSACDGVVASLAAQGVGFATAYGPVPIVVGLGLFDLGVGDPSARPDATAGAEALAAATAHPESGQVGAGTGATIGKWRGVEFATDGGLGLFSIRDGDLVVSTIVAVNAAGEVMPDAVAKVDDRARVGQAVWPEDRRPFGNTVIGVVVTNASLDSAGCLVVAQGAHDGLARAVSPPHMGTDGDGFVAAATGTCPADVDHVRYLAVLATEAAIGDSVANLSR
jgi:L-aminopeptidase/D-esterase-like protein